MECSKPVVQISGSAYILLAFMLLLLPLPWVIAVIFAALVHEAFHAVAAHILSGRIYALHIGAGGAKMEIGPLEPSKEWFVALAGPMGSAVLVLFAKWIPRTAVCALLHCVFNLLPLYPLDGGRFLSCLISILSPGKKGERIFLASQRVIRFVITVIGLFIACRWGILPTAMLMLLLNLKRNKRTV